MIIGKYNISISLCPMVDKHPISFHSKYDIKKAPDCSGALSYLLILIISSESFFLF
jgi:hypothetical protein